MTGLLTLDDVCRVLQITVRQLKRLRTGPDPLPVIHLSRRIMRVDPASLRGWLARRGMDSSIPSGYS